MGIERFNSIHNNYNSLYKKNNTKKNNTINNDFENFILTIVNFINEFNTLINYTNKQLSIISYTYNLKVNIVQFNNYNWDSISKKFTHADILKIDNTNEASCSYL